MNAKIKRPLSVATLAAVTDTKAGSLHVASVGQIEQPVKPDVLVERMAAAFVAGDLAEADRLLRAWRQAQGV